MSVRRWLEIADRVRRQTPLPEPYVHTKESYVLAYGESFHSAPLAPKEQHLLARVEEAYGAPFQRQECFHNAVMLLTYDESEQLEYVEGFFGRTNLPVEVYHAWVSLHGKVIDLTLEPQVRGTFTDLEYVGVVFPRATVLEKASQMNRAAPLLDDWEHDWPLLRRVAVHT